MELVYFKTGDLCKRRRPKPWEDHDGELLPAPILRERAKTWSEETWEKFLQAVEPMPRQPVVTPLEEDIAEEKEPAPEKIPDTLSNHLRALIQRLSESERVVVQGIFWERLSQRELAKRLGVSRTTVQSYLERALQRMRALLPSTLPIYIEGHEIAAPVSQPSPLRAINKRKGKQID